MQSKVKRMLISNFATALALTEIIELAVAWLLGCRKRHELSVIFLINLATNPLANFIVLVAYNLLLLKINIYFLLAIETFVIITETLVLSYALDKKLKGAFVLSLAINSVSFAFGLLLNPNTLAL